MHANQNVCRSIQQVDTFILNNPFITHSIRDEVAIKGHTLKIDPT